MSKPLKNYLSFTTLIIFFAAAIASSPKNMVYSDGDKWIPGNFDANKTTLLIESHPLGKHQNERMIKFLEDRYPFSFEVVDSNTINAVTGRYADTKKYPFALRWKPQNSYYTTTSYSNNRFSTLDHRTWDMYGYFIDRVNNKQFAATDNGNVWGQVGYRPVFNSIKKKFKDK